MMRGISFDFYEKMTIIRVVGNHDPFLIPI